MRMRGRYLLHGLWTLRLRLLLSARIDNHASEADMGVHQARLKIVQSDDAFSSLHGQPHTISYHAWHSMIALSLPKYNRRDSIH